MGRQSVMRITVVALLALLTWGCGPAGDRVDYRGSGVLDSVGGMLQAADLTIEAEPGDVFDAVRFEVTPTRLPALLPQGLQLAASPVDISVDDAYQFARPVTISMRYDDRGIPDEESMLVFHYDQEIGYEAVTLLAHDTEANVITFESRVFSPFVVTFANDGPPSHFDTGFDPAVHGWGIDNFGGAFSDGGHCLGMASYAQWYFAHGSGNLFNKYDKETATITIMRAHLAQSQRKAYSQYQQTNNMGNTRFARAIKGYLSRTGRPLIFDICKPRDEDGLQSCHVLVFYAYDPDGLTLYDVNYVGEDAVKKISYKNGNFGSYGSYKYYGYIARPSLGRTENFDSLTAQAEGGFKQADYIKISKPKSENEDGVIILRDDEVMVEGAIQGGFNRHYKLYSAVKDIWHDWKRVTVEYNNSFDIRWYNLDKPGKYRLLLVAGVSGDLWDYQSQKYRNCDTIVIEAYRPYSAETDCHDGIDNDADGQTDCYDDECGCDPCGAVPLRCGDVIRGSTVGGSRMIDMHTGCSDWDASGPEQIYVLRDAPAGMVRADLATPGGAPLALFVHEDGCTPEHCTAGGDPAIEFQHDPETLTYLVVDGHQGAAGSYTLTVDCGPERNCDDGIDNDGDGLIDEEDVLDCADPCGAVPVRCGEVIQDTTVGGSNLIDVHSGCSDWDDTGPERIYVLRDAEPGTVHANIVAMQEGMDLDVFVHEDGCAPETCKEMGSHEAWCGVDPDKTYYIIVDGYQGDAGTFTLEIDCL